MKKVLDVLKSNIAFFVILVVSLVFYLIAVCGGDFQTSVFWGEVTHYSFVNGAANGRILSFLYVIIPAVCMLAITVLNFVKPKKRDGKLALVFVGLFIGLATLAGVMLLLIPIALFNEVAVDYTAIGDWKALTADVYYTRTFNFPLLSMVISLIFTLVLGCFASATLSD